ncbi:phage tail tube protein [Pseudomonas sp.]|uniref:phage tail tube protein n=1 Tax=Pseudomonas sp. TaxID=306 RepID=UPI003D10F312
MAKKLGKAKIKVDGKVLESMPGARLDIGGDERTTVIGSNAVQGFFETPKQSVLECEVSVGKETKLAEMRGWDNVTLSFECDTGQLYVVQGAWLTNTPNMTASEGGRVPMTFEGPPAEEML